jgi:hypothetical protein
LPSWQTYSSSNTEAIVVPLAMRPMRLRIVIGHKTLMGSFRCIPTRDLLKMHLTHAPHHVKMGLDEIFPALPRMNVLLLNLQCLTNGQKLLGAKHRAIVGDERFWRAKALDSCIQHNQDAGQILLLKNGAGENGS